MPTTSASLLEGRDLFEDPADGRLDHLRCVAAHGAHVLDLARRGQEVAPFGIQTCLVEPGGARTDFAGRSLAMGPANDA